MFFNAHVYYSQRVDKNLDALKVAGSIIPDFASTGLITFDDLHKKAGILSFSEYVNKVAPEFSSLLKGINYHDTLDYFSHLEYKGSTPGYAYANVTPQLFELVKKALNADDSLAKSMSHNAIESAVDYHLLSENPEIANLIRNSLKEIDSQKLASIIADFYNKQEAEVATGLKNFFAFATDYDFISLDEFVRLWVDLDRFFLKRETDKQYIKEALELAITLTKDTWKEYLESSIASSDKSIRDCN